MRKLLALSVILASPALAQQPNGTINAPIYATGYISQVGGTNVTTKIPPQPNHPTNLNIYTTGAISGTWSIQLPNPAFEGQILSFNCSAAANTIAITSSDGSSIDSNLPTSCATNGGFVVQFDLRSNIWRSLGTGYSANFRPFTGVTSQWPWQLNVDGTWTLKQPQMGDIAGAVGVSIVSTPYSADPTGVVDASTALTSALSANGKVFIPCGTYLIAAPIFVPSNREIEGAGSCAVLKISASLATDTSAEFGVLRHVFTNNDYTSGNTDIYIRNLSIDNTSGPTTGVHIHAIGFYKVTRGGVSNVTITSAAGKLLDDGVAFVASKEYSVRNNKIYGTINACIDQWGGSTDFEISGNICDGLNLNNYGILVSGFNTNLTAATSQRGIISNNVVKNFPGAGIWLQGGWNGVTGGGATYGLVKKVSVIGNSVSGISGYHGIYLTDASNNTVVGNTMENIGRLGLVVTSENGGVSTNNVLSDNVIVSCNAAAASSPCIQLMPSASNNTFDNNTIVGSAQSYSYVINGGATGNIIRGGITPVGTISDISDGGTGTQIQIGNAFATTPTFKSLTGYVKGNGASAATASATIPTTDLSGLGTGVATALGNATDASGGLLTYGMIGTAGTKLPLLSTANTWSLGQIFLAGVSSATYVIAGGASYLGFNARTIFDSASDGVIRVSNWGQTDFSRLQLGGTSASFPAIKRSAASIAFRLADDSADAAIAAGAITASGKITGPASASGAATLNAPHGTAPSSPVNGDIWTTTGGMYARINGATVGPLHDTGSNVGLHTGVSEAAFRVSQLNLNATGDTAITFTMPQGATRWVLFAVRLSNSTGNLPNGTGTLGFYTGAGRTGTTLVAQAALNTIITTAAADTSGNSGTMTNGVANNQAFTATTIYANVQTAQGATSAIDVAIVLRFF